MAEIATLARPYAEALFMATERDSESTLVWLDALAVVGADVQLLRFANDPKVSQQQIYDLVAGVVGTSLPQLAQNFLRAVIESRRLAVLHEVAAQYRAMRNARSGTSDATVFSAFAIEPAALADVSVALERRFGRKLNISVAEDPALIGGIRVVVGDEVLDTSVKARLEQMKVALTA